MHSFFFFFLSTVTKSDSNNYFLLLICFVFHEKKKNMRVGIRIFSLKHVIFVVIVLKISQFNMQKQ